MRDLWRTRKSRGWEFVFKWASSHSRTGRKVVTRLDIDNCRCYAGYRRSGHTGFDSVDGYGSGPKQPWERMPKFDHREAALARLTIRGTEEDGYMLLSKPQHEIEVDNEILRIEHCIIQASHVWNRVGELRDALISNHDQAQLGRPSYTGAFNLLSGIQIWIRVAAAIRSE